MLKDEIKAELSRDPFIPLVLHLKNGKKIKVPFPQAAHVMKYDMLVVISPNLETRRAKGYITFDFDSVARIQQMRGGSPRRRKAS
jgi:hypothetical protein